MPRRRGDASYERWLGLQIFMDDKKQWLAILMDKENKTKIDPVYGCSGGATGGDFECRKTKDWQF